MRLAWRTDGSRPRSRSAGRQAVALGIALLLVIGAGSVGRAATPPNDDRAAATVVEAVPFEVDLDTSEATPDASDLFCSSGTDNPTVWFSFTPAASGTYGVSTYDSEYDTTVALAAGADGDTEVIACNDDAGSTSSAIVLELEAGTDYDIMVGACCDQPGGRLQLQIVRDPEVGSPAFQLPPDLSGFFALRPRGDAGPLWLDATAATIGATGAWTNKVEVADVDGDGLLDILHANGGDYDTPGTPEPPAVYLNAGPGVPFRDATQDVFGDGAYIARVVKARDVTGDGVVDILLGTTYGSQSRLFRGLGGGAFEDVTETSLPAVELSVGDLEVGDVDADGDIDIVLADWGPGSPLHNEGGPVWLWRNEGDAWVEDALSMPSALVGFSWDLELVDVDGDWDLDVLVSCKVCETSRLYLNDGTGLFSDATETHMPPSANNYEFEAMDLDGDGDPDLATINDGVALGERVLRNDGGVFSDVTAEWWPPDQNPGFDDNVIAFLDVESDGDADFVVGSLDGPDRLMINDGTGRLLADPTVFEGPPTPGTLHLALADLDGDGRLDVVEGEGEVADEDHVFLATEALAPDSAAPAIDAIDVRPVAGGIEVRARVHDRKSPVQIDDFRALTVALSDSEPSVPMTWYGDALWRAVLESGVEAMEVSAVTVCATDRVGNEACREAP